MELWDKSFLAAAACSLSLTVSCGKSNTTADINDIGLSNTTNGQIDVIYQDHGLVKFKTCRDNVDHPTRDCIAKKGSEASLMPDEYFYILTSLYGVSGYQVTDAAIARISQQIQDILTDITDGSLSAGEAKKAQAQHDLLVKAKTIVLKLLNFRKNLEKGNDSTIFDYREDFKPLRQPFLTLWVSQTGSYLYMGMGPWSLANSTCNNLGGDWRAPNYIRDDDAHFIGEFRAMINSDFERLLPFYRNPLLGIKEYRVWSGNATRVVDVETRATFWEINDFTHKVEVHDQSTVNSDGKEAEEAIICISNKSFVAPADQDHDGIADAVDQCKNTPSEAFVWTEGEWAGCSKGQKRDKP